MRAARPFAPTRVYQLVRHTMSDLPVPHAGRRRPRPAARRRRGGGTDEVRPPSRPGPAGACPSIIFAPHPLPVGDGSAFRAEIDPRSRFESAGGRPCPRIRITDRSFRRPPGATGARGGRAGACAAGPAPRADLPLSRAARARMKGFLISAEKEDFFAEVRGNGPPAPSAGGAPPPRTHRLTVASVIDPAARPSVRRRRGARPGRRR